MRLTYLGHAAVLIETAEHTLLIDPFLAGNPSASASPHAVGECLIVEPGGTAEL